MSLQKTTPEGFRALWPSHLSGIVKIALVFIAVLGIVECTEKKVKTAEDFVSVSPDGQFMLHGEPYRYIGANYWYGALLGAPNKGDRARLEADLDSLKSQGLTNLRILVGAEGGDVHRTSHVEPSLQTSPGIYDADMLAGLDFLLAELEKRDMRAVLYLTNSWEWSGGYGQYLEWAGKGPAPIPAEIGYQAYCDSATRFFDTPEALAMYADHVGKIVGRTNSITGEPYSESTAIMSWQICNEPRPFSERNKKAMAAWLTSTSDLIRSLDPNHLISTGSEGKYGCQADIDEWVDIHSYKNIDYATIHIWPANWGWVTDSTLISDMPLAKMLTDEYVREHAKALADAKVVKPLVLEEFGYPRDGREFSPDSPATARAEYYSHVFDIFREADSPLAGVNFWGWTNTALPPHTVWMPGDPYTADPAQEPQGLYSVFPGEMDFRSITADR